FPNHEPLGKVNTRNDRLNAFRATMAKYPERYTEQAEVRLADADGLDQVLQDFYQRHRKRRCAVMVVNGALTLQVARAMKRIGLDWGRQIGLLGFDELAWAELAGVGITTLQQPTWQIGYSALEKVIERINGDITPAKQQVFSGKLIIRGSTRFPS
ncbi:LacI family transcriptional regulator, partial [Erwinia tracheiphila PSU-1]|uniref:substrate-binding domain-containing protein n=1 Tax=Erwinia tracheiphila TaxID=65700 RepID=UPI00033DC8A7